MFIFRGVRTTGKKDLLKMNFLRNYFGAGSTVHIAWEPGESGTSIGRRVVSQASDFAETP